MSKFRRDKSFIHPELGEIRDYEWVYEFQWDNQDGTSRNDMFVFPLFYPNHLPSPIEQLETYRKAFDGWTCEEVSENQRIYVNPSWQNSLVS